MRLLLDTHTFLWFVFGDIRFSANARQMIEDAAHDKFLSIASIWEISIKVKTTKLTIGQPLEAFFSEQMQINGFGLLPIEISHATRVAALPLHHREPFDRLLIMQSLVEDMPLISADAAFDAYGVQRIW